MEAKQLYNLCDITCPPTGTPNQYVITVDKAFYQLWCRLQSLKQSSLVWLIVDGMGTPREIVGIVPTKREALGE